MGRYGGRKNAGEVLFGNGRQEELSLARRIADSERQDASLVEMDNQPKLEVVVMPRLAETSQVESQDEAVLRREHAVEATGEQEAAQVSEVGQTAAVGGETLAADVPAKQTPFAGLAKRWQEAATAVLERKREDELAGLSGRAAAARSQEQTERLATLLGRRPQEQFGQAERSNGFGAGLWRQEAGFSRQEAVLGGEPGKAGSQAEDYAQQSNWNRQKSGPKVESARGLLAEQQELVGLIKGDELVADKESLQESQNVQASEVKLEQVMQYGRSNLTEEDREIAERIFLSRLEDFGLPRTAEAEQQVREVVQDLGLGPGAFEQVATYVQEAEFVILDGSVSFDKLPILKHFPKALTKHLSGGGSVIYSRTLDKFFPGGAIGADTGMLGPVSATVSFYHLPAEIAAMAEGKKHDEIRKLAIGMSYDWTIVPGVGVKVIQTDEYQLEGLGFGWDVSRGLGYNADKQKAQADLRRVEVDLLDWLRRAETTSPQGGD